MYLLILSYSLYSGCFINPLFLSFSLAVFLYKLMTFHYSILLFSSLYLLYIYSSLYFCRTVVFALQLPRVLNKISYSCNSLFYIIALKCYSFIPPPLFNFLNIFDIRIHLFFWYPLISYCNYNYF